MKNNKKYFNLEIGKLGEDLACRFLTERGFDIVERNYRKKWGEIDIVARETQKIRFIEVKSVLSEIKDGNVTRETYFMPEDAVQPWKIKRLRRAIQSYILEKKFSDTAEWQFDIIAIFVDYDRRMSKIRFIQNMIL